MYWTKCENCYKELNFGGEDNIINIRHRETRLHNLLDLPRALFEEFLANHHTLPPSCLALTLRPKKNCLLNHHFPK